MYFFYGKAFHPVLAWRVIAFKGTNKQMTDGRQMVIYISYFLFCTALSLSFSFIVLGSKQYIFNYKNQDLVSTVGYIWKYCYSD